MKILTCILLTLAGSIISTTVLSQNVLLNIITKNSGTVNVKGTVYLEATICNTSATIIVPVYKLKPQFSCPPALVSIPDTGHILPNGWTIIFNNGAVIRLSNGSDQVAANECRTILIALKGKAAGGPSAILANLLFSNGTAPGSEPGNPTTGDNPADNASGTTIKVLK